MASSELTSKQMTVLVQLLIDKGLITRNELDKYMIQLQNEIQVEEE